MNDFSGILMPLFYNNLVSVQIFLIAQLHIGPRIDQHVDNLFLIRRCGYPACKIEALSIPHACFGITAISDVSKAAMCGFRDDAALRGGCA